MFRSSWRVSGSNGLRRSDKLRRLGRKLAEQKAKEEEGRKKRSISSKRRKRRSGRGMRKRSGRGRET